MNGCQQQAVADDDREAAAAATRQQMHQNAIERFAPRSRPEDKSFPVAHTAGDIECLKTKSEPRSSGTWKKPHELRRGARVVQGKLEQRHGRQAVGARRKLDARRREVPAEINMDGRRRPPCSFVATRPGTDASAQPERIVRRRFCWPTRRCAREHDQVMSNEPDRSALPRSPRRRERQRELPEHLCGSR